MRLSDYKVSAQIAVSDMAQAASFYEGKLGLPVQRKEAGGSRTYACGEGSSLHVYPAPTHAAKATATVARWNVQDIEKLVDELTSSGVIFEQYDEPATNAKGIHDTGYGTPAKVAWFKDPDGNTFAIEQT
jgi:catechol 2,3-dioxygenase-like lactoylglutathione lyase family enzyme